MPLENDRSVTGVLQDIIGNIQGIIRSEVQLAKAEITQEAVKASKASAMLGAGALLGIYALGFILLFCVLALARALPLWLSALLVGIVVSIAAAVCVSVGKKRMQQVHPTPEKTIETVKENLEWAKNQTK